MRNPDKKREVESSLLAADFSDLEKRIMAWGEWAEGPIISTEFVSLGTVTGRFLNKSDPETQHLASAPEDGVASGPIVNTSEER